MKFYCIKLLINIPIFHQYCQAQLNKKCDYLNIPVNKKMRINKMSFSFECRIQDLSQFRFKGEKYGFRNQLIISRNFPEIVSRSNLLKEGWTGKDITSFDALSETGSESLYPNSL
jgi:hypothetical protein